MPLLATRCHDEGAASLYDSILAMTWTLDEDVRGVARDIADDGALLVGSERVVGGDVRALA